MENIGFNTLSAEGETGNHARPPSVIVDLLNNRIYRVGKFLGKGGYASCYELINEETQEKLACKVLSNQIIQQRHQKEKIAQEIVIHRFVKNEYVVRFHSYFQDELNLYIVLELCSNGTLAHLQKRRKTLQEIEARYFLRQLLLGVNYLHNQNIIHRDLKAGNVFIHEDMTLRIGDFGLATLLDYIGERKVTVCGTPNFIAPEILIKAGHGVEADIWSIGVILYLLLVGYAPFETRDLNETYQVIRTATYNIPDGKISIEAQQLLQRIFVPDPTKRITLHQILQSDFMTKQYIPKSLPRAILSVAPRYIFTDTVSKSDDDAKVNA